MLRFLTVRSRTLACPNRSIRPSSIARFVHNAAHDGRENAARTDTGTRITTQFKHLRDTYKPTRYPIVLCHGLFGFDQIVIGKFVYKYWNGLAEVLEDHGARILSDSVPPFGSIKDRAQTLQKMILDEKEGFEKVNLIGHSMGGLDARYLAAKLTHPNFKIQSVTTIASPHHGTYLADLALPVTSRLPGTMGAFAELARCKMAEFNEQVQDVEGIYYSSYGAQAAPSWANPLYPTWRVLNKHEGANDGLVSVDSSKWGDYKGTIDRADHLDVINLSQYKRKTRNTDFNAAAMYLHVMDELAQQGF